MSENPLSIQSDEAKWFQLWGWYLRASTSYGRARFYRSGTSFLGDDLPADFDDVVRVFDALGSVRDMSMLKWWPDGCHPTIWCFSRPPKGNEPWVNTVLRRGRSFFAPTKQRQGLFAGGMAGSDSANQHHRFHPYRLAQGTDHEAAIRDDRRIGCA